MTNVESFWCHEASNIRCVRESDYAALEQECERLRGCMNTYNRAHDEALAQRDAALLQAEALRVLLLECQKLLSAEPHGILSGMADQRKRADWYQSMTPVRDRIDAALQAKPDHIRDAAKIVEPSAPPDNCRQRLMKRGSPYPSSSCAACGMLSPKWKECYQALQAKP